MTKSDDYVLGRSITDSVRLDAQHLLWKLHKGYELHPQIPITSDMKIAELGTGTGVWVFDLAQQLPPTVQLYGFDISDAQYPPRKLWPENVSLGILDSLVAPPKELTGQFDVVHLRMWASNLRGKDTSSLISHIKSLLKPGGYVQWEDADLIHQSVEGAKAKEFESSINEIFQKADLDYGWVSDLGPRFQKHDFAVLESERGCFKHALAQLCTNTYLMALREILQGIKKVLGHQALLSITEVELALYHLSLQNTGGIVYNWSPTTILAQKRG